MKKFTERLAFRNLTGHPGRTAALTVLVALLTFAVCSGTLIVSSLNNGLHALRDRMGADIMVVPYEATTRSDVDAENIMMFGNMGYFYMDSGLYDKLAEREGVGQISAQFFLSTVSSSCCSYPVQIVGFDPDTDFTILPWIKSRYGSDLRDMEVVVGHDLNAFVGDTLTFYGTDVKVAAKLDKTGTNLDTAVYTNADTIRSLIQASMDLKLNSFRNLDPDRVVSSVLINVADGYSVDEVLNDINVHVRKVRAYRTTNMIEGIAGSLDGVATIIRLLSVCIWVLSLVILVIVFMLSANERRKEFALLRALGASVRKTSRVAAEESFIVSVSGAFLGALLSCLLIVLFAGMIESSLAVPFLLPGALVIALSAAFAVLLGVVCGMLAGASAVRSAGQADAGLLLRGA